MSLNIREYLNSGFYHRRNLFKIQGLLNHCLKVRLCHLIKPVKFHGLHILAIHPAQLGHIKYSRRLAHTVIVKFPDHFLQRKNFPVILRRPAKQSHIVHHCLRDKALLYQILK